MRIISGIAGGVPLQVPRGEVRPTTDRVREALFSILGTRVEGARVLELFAGSGGLGLEALSRGAASARFVDASRNSCRMVEENMRKARLTGGHVVNADCLQFVKRERARYDLVFADPPYCKYVGDRDMIAELMHGRLRELMEPGGLFVAEAQLGYGGGDARTCEFDGWQLVDQRHYGKNTILFYTAQEG